MSRLSILPFAIVVAAFAGAVSAGPVPADISADSRIVSVTVYPDRAMITREAKAELTPGLKHVRLEGLSPLLQDQTVRVSASGSAAARLLEVKVERTFPDTVPAERLRPLLQAQKTLNDQLRALGDRAAVIAHQKEFLNKITIASQESVSRELRTQTPSTESLAKLLGFFDAQLTRLNREARDAQDEDTALREKLSAVEKQIAGAGGSTEKSQKTIIVAFDVSRGGPLKIEASYLIGAAGWTPAYDLRASSADTAVELTYAANVRQNTGEDWTGVHLALSTSQPALGSAPPEISPWYVGAADRARGSVEGTVRDGQTGEPLIGVNVLVTGSPLGSATDAAGFYRIDGLPAGWQVLRATYVGYRTVNVRVNVRPFAIARADVSMEPQAVEAAEVVVTAESPMQKGATARDQRAIGGGKAPAPPPLPVAVQTAEVHAGLISASFPISGATTVPSDFTDHRVTVMIAPLAASFTHTSVPKLQPGAFFRAALRNSTDFPVLAGAMSVYVDNAFVSTSKLPDVMPGEKFDAFLGADNGIRVERKLLAHVTDVSGLFSKTRTTRYEILITAENKRGNTQSLTLKENVPVSQDERIKVVIELPHPDELKPDAEGICTWDITLAPGEKREFRLKYSIEAPVDLNVGGIE